MAGEARSRERYSEAFWRTHHEAWRQSDLNQREYCEAQELSLKAFGNWRAKFKAEPQQPPRKLLYRRSGLSHRLSHTLSHMTTDAPEPTLIVPPATRWPSAELQRVGQTPHRRRIGATGASLSEVGMSE